MKIFVYKIDDHMIGVVAESGTVAIHGMQQRYPGKTYRYIATLDDFFQIQGNLVMDGEVTVIEETTNQPTEKEKDE